MVPPTTGRSHSPADLREGARTVRRYSVCPGTTPAGIRRESNHVVRLNLSGAFKALRSLFARVHDANQPTRVAYILRSNPAFLCLVAVHTSNVAKGLEYVRTEAV